jgi:hypothetical protein
MQFVVFSFLIIEMEKWVKPTNWNLCVRAHKCMFSQHIYVEKEKKNFFFSKKIYLSLSNPICI